MSAVTAITEPGLYDLPAAVYHADPVPDGSLSVTRAKVLLDEGGPAKFRHQTEHGMPHMPAFDLGTAAHALVLGKGLEQIMHIDYDSYRTVRAREARDEAYARGLTPLLASERRQVEDMAEALSRHTLAMETLTGRTEVAMFHQLEDGSGVWLRGQADVITDGWTADYKTTVDASGAGFARSVWRYRYHMQAAWYRRLRQWITGELVPFRLVAQEKAAPYLVSVWEPSRDYIELGEADMDDAIALYQSCRLTGKWPGYPDELQTLIPPDWATDDDDMEA